jgi:hypothetical protein
METLDQRPGGEFIVFANAVYWTHALILTSQAGLLGVKHINSFVEATDKMSAVFLY